MASDSMHQEQHSRSVRLAAREQYPLSWVNQYVGIPWERLNCWELIRTVYQERLRIQLPQYSGVDPNDVLTVARLMDQQRHEYDWEETKTPEEYDVCLMRGIVKERRVWAAPTHCGLVVGLNSCQLLHTQMGHASVCVDRHHPSVFFRILGFYRLKDE